MTGVESRRIQQRNPYAPVGDFLSNLNNFKIIESTLREGEQFANAFFDTVSALPGPYCPNGPCQASLGGCAGDTWAGEQTQL